jgi:hypothetical protein
LSSSSIITAGRLETGGLEQRVGNGLADVAELFDLGWAKTVEDMLPHAAYVDWRRDFECREASIREDGICAAGVWQSLASQA